MTVALRAWLAALDRGFTLQAATVSAAEAVAGRPWDVVRYAGFLARCRAEVAPADLGLTAALRVVSVDNDRAVVRISAGQRYPTPDHEGRRARGAFDTPIEMARRLVAASIAASRRPIHVGLDLACGPGAFLVAMEEAGIPEILGNDLDEVAVAVAKIAVPKARITVADALAGGPKVDLVVGNPPYVPPEHQDKALRLELRRRFPWLEGRFDLVVPLGAMAVERVASGGAVGLVLPSPSLVQPYAIGLRRRWIQRHRIVELAGPQPFPGAAVQVTLLVMEVDGGPAPLPAFGTPADEVLRLPGVPLSADVMPGDVDIVEKIRAVSVPLSELCLVDTGVVAHGPDTPRAKRLFDEPGPGRVPYADAKDFFAGRSRWLQYEGEKLHRAKRPEMFTVPKIVVQRLRGDGPVRASIDATGLYVGHTCTVIVPRAHAQVPLERLLELVRSAMTDGLLRIERGDRLDLYPRDVASLPVPRIWLTRPSTPLEKAWGLGAREVAQLGRFARR